MLAVPDKLPDATTHPHLKTVTEAFVIHEGGVGYRVMISDGPRRRLERLKHLRIRRLDDKPIPNYQIFQQIKNHFFGEDTVAVQVFPKVKDYIDNTNTYHLFTWKGIDVPNLKEMYEYKKI
jgi:hypothetical protein